MSNLSIDWSGHQQLQRKLESMKKMNAMRQIVKTNTSEMDKKMTSNAVFVKGYSTGATRRSISSEIRNGGLEGAVRPNTEYSSYVEYGTRKMSAQRFVRPAFNVQKHKFLSDLRRLVK